jgi:hypothetical protein
MIVKKLLIFLGFLSFPVEFLLEKIGLCGIITVILIPKLGSNGMIMFFLGLLAQVYFQYWIFCGLLGNIIVMDMWGIALTAILLALMIVSLLLSFGKISLNQQLTFNYHDINKKMKKRTGKITHGKILDFFLNLSIKIISYKKIENQLFHCFSYQIQLSTYPLSYLYYDLVAYFKSPNIFTIIGKNNGNHLTTQVNIIVFQDLLFDQGFYETKRYLSLIWRPKLLFFNLTGGSNYCYFGIRANSNFLMESLNILYNIFIIDGFQKFSWEYYAKYIFPQVLKNKQNIIYILKNIPMYQGLKEEEKIEKHYKYITEQLERATLQSRLQKNKNVVVFLFYQLVHLVPMIETLGVFSRQINYLRSLVRNSIGYYHIIIIEKDSKIISDLFYPEDNLYIGSIERHTCIFINKANNMETCHKLSNCYGIENNAIPSIWLFQHREKNFLCALPYQ